MTYDTSEQELRKTLCAFLLRHWTGNRELSRFLRHELADFPADLMPPESQPRAEFTDRVVDLLLSRNLVVPDLLDTIETRRPKLRDRLDPLRAMGTDPGLTDLVPGRQPLPFDTRVNGNRALDALAPATRDGTLVICAGRHLLGPGTLLDCLDALSTDPTSRAALRVLTDELPHQRPTQTHRLLALLRPRRCVSLSPDALLARAMHELDRDVRTWSEDPQFTSVRDAHGLVVNLTGATENPTTLRLDRSNFRAMLRRGSLLARFTALLLATNPVLYVGCGPHDFARIRDLCSSQGVLLQNLTDHYALITDERPDPDSPRAWCDALGIRPIRVDPALETPADHPTDFLTRLWETRSDYGLYVHPIESAPPRDPGLLLELAVNHYRASAYEQAEERFAALEPMVRDHPTRTMEIFPRYAYFRTKLLDKRECWDALPELERDLEAHFRRLERYLPPAVLRIQRSQYLSALAMPALRSLQLDRALAAIDEALEAPCSPPAPGVTASRHPAVLRADRLTVRALVHLERAVFGPADEGASLEAASEDLDGAMSLFRLHTASDGSQPEVHYLGRWYGARAFLEMHSLDRAEPVAPAAADEVLAWARASHERKERVPYGVLAGQYCEACCRWFLAHRVPGHLDPREQLERALHLLRNPVLKPSTLLVRSRYAGLGLAVARSLSRISEQPVGDLDAWEDRDAASRRELGTRGPASLRQIVLDDEEGFERWLTTPLN